MNTHREDLNIKNDKVKGEGEGHGADEPHVGPRGHRHQRLVLWQAVHGVQHLDGHKYGEGHGHGMGVSEDLAVDTLKISKYSLQSVNKAEEFLCLNMQISGTHFESKYLFVLDSPFIEKGQRI